MDYSGVDTEVQRHSVKGIVMRKDKVGDMNELFATVDSAGQLWFEGVDSVTFGAAGEFLEAEVK
jgi:hypothetical protein